MLFRLFSFWGKIDNLAECNNKHSAFLLYVMSKLVECHDIIIISLKRYHVNQKLKMERYND